MMLQTWTMLMIATMKSMMWMSAFAFVDNRPDCFESCSEQVRCTVSPYNNFCGAAHGTEITEGPDFAAEPVDLQVERVHDQEHQYVHLSWRPHKGGSYNYITGFLVQVSVISLDHSQNGVTAPMCYKILPASNWQQTHRKLYRSGGVTFFMNCLRASADSNLHMVISIHSLPLTSEAPKLAMQTVDIHSFSDAGFYNWNPQFKKWVDADGVMHLVIQNPLKEAKFYDVQIQSVERDKNMFSHVFPAVPDNRTHDEPMVVNQDGLPHFLIHGLNKEDNYTILMDVLDGNETRLPHILSIQTNPFSLNFSSAVLASRLIADNRGDNKLVTIIVSGVCLTVAVGVAVVVFLVRRGVIHPTKLQGVFHDLARKMGPVTSQRAQTFTAIYCHESNHFVAAVEGHISLLRRYSGASYVPMNSWTSKSVCESRTPHETLASADLKIIHCVIYLSPRLREILDLDQSDLSQSGKNLDIQCRKALLSLPELCLREKTKMLHLVTFDCFHQVEVTFLDDLINAICPQEWGKEKNLFSPVKLASLGPNGWRLENIEPLLLKLHGLLEVPQDLQQDLKDWGSCSESANVQQHLLLHSELQALDDSIFSSDHDSTSYSMDFDCASPSPESKLSFDESDYIFSETFCKSHDELNSLDGDFQLSADAPLLVFSNRSVDGSDLCPSDSSYEKPDPQSSFLDPEVPSTSRYQPLTQSEQISDSPNRQLLQLSHNQATSQIYSSTECHETAELKARKVERTNTESSETVIWELSYHKEGTSPVNFADSDSLLKNNDFIGHPSHVGGLQNEALDDNDLNTQAHAFPHSKPMDCIIPPSLCHSTCTSMDSVCERINKVNENTSWSEINLAAVICD